MENKKPSAFRVFVVMLAANVFTLAFVYYVKITGFVVKKFKIKEKVYKNLEK